MSFDYINEAFKRLTILDEELFDTSFDGINNLSTYIDSGDTEETVRVIDDEAASDDDLKDSYVGKVIVNCNVCHSHLFKNKEDIVIDEDGVVNPEDTCSFCGESEGFVIVGEIAPYEDNESETTTEEPEESTVEDATETSDESMLEEAVESKDANVSTRMSRASRVAQNSTLEEDFKEVSITTDDQHLEMTSDDNGKVTVTTEPVANMDNYSEETISPISDETTEEILSNNEQPEETFEDEEPAEDDFDVEFDDIDETSFDDLGESYLRRVYENVESFKTTDVSANDSALFVEGVIKFTSGAKKKTQFMFEAKDMDVRGRVRFEGSNKNLTESVGAYSLVGIVDNKRLFLESLRYNYKVNEEFVRGKVSRK